jgi:hypothetical protein
MQKTNFAFAAKSRKMITDMTSLAHRHHHHHHGDNVSAEVRE